MLLLTGEYEAVMDSKSRVFVSNKLRNQIDVDEHGGSFYLTLGANGVLCLYPEKCFQQIALAVAPGIGAPDESLVFERLSFALAGRVELDRQGRLLIGDKFRTRARLGEKLTLVGVRDHIEIWNSDDWQQYVSSNLPQFQTQTMQARQFALQKQSKEL